MRRARNAWTKISRYLLKKIPLVRSKPKVLCSPPQQQKDNKHNKDSNSSETMTWFPFSYIGKDSSTSVISPNGEQTLIAKNSLKEVSQVERAGIKETMTIENVTIEDCLNVITSVEKYPEFLPVYERVEILSRNGGENSIENVMARYHIHVPLIARAIFKTLSYGLHLRISKQEDCATMEWEGIQSDQPHGITANTGMWTITRSASGTGVDLTLEIDLMFTLALPSWIRKWLIEHVLHDSLNSYKARIVELGTTSQKCK